MAEPVDVDALAARAYRLVQQGDLQAAVEVADAALPHAQHRPALAARLHAWACQALLAEGEGKAARKRLSQALKAARSTGQPAEVKALQPLQAQVMAALTARARPAAVPDTPAARAVAAYDRGDAAAGEALAEAAIAAAEASGDAREAVMARLALARSPARREAAIREAAEVADAAGDHNLITAVAHAARAASVPLAPKVF